MAEKVRAWTENYKMEQEQIAQKATEQAPPPEEVRLPDDPLLQGNAQEKAMETAMPTFKKVEVSEMEVDLYLKAVLNDKPVMLNIEVMGGNMNLKFRSRTMHEQERVLAVVRQDVKDKFIDESDAALAYTRLQQYCMCLQLLSINGENFSSLTLDPGSKFDKDVAELRSAFIQHLPGMSAVRWMALFEGLVTFESKCRKMAEECLNSDFWKPRG